VIDHVFLLSEDEVKKYFRTDNDRIAMYNNQPHRWWLRTIDVSVRGIRDVSVVAADGYLTSMYSEIWCDHVGVRPAIWVKLLV
jgi:hypothetical protein